MSNIDSYLIVPLGVEHVTVMAKIENQAHTHPWSETGLKECFGPLYRVLGIKLQDGLLGFAKDAGAVVLMLEVRQSNEAAKYLYEKVGFIESGRRKNYYPTDDGYEDAILMDLALS